VFTGEFLNRKHNAQHVKQRGKKTNPPMTTKLTQTDTQNAKTGGKVNAVRTGFA
jgi:hypothetical protein